jgi:ribonuclease HI
MSKKFKGFFDGSARPNPGEMQCGFVIYNPNGLEISRGSKKLGYGTNNRSEYYGLIELLKTAIQKKINHIIIYGDSEIIIKQMKNEYKVKNKNLKLLWQEAQKLILKFESVEWQHVPRNQNFIADNLSRI